MNNFNEMIGLDSDINNCDFNVEEASNISPVNCGVSVEVVKEEIER
jgi:hypothetical protein